MIGGGDIIEGGEGNVIGGGDIGRGHVRGRGYRERTCDRGTL